MPAIKKYKGFKIKRLSGKTETVISVLQGGYKTDAGGKMVSWRKVSIKGDKLKEHADRVNPDGTPYESTRGRKAKAKPEKAKPATSKKEKEPKKVKKNIGKAVSKDDEKPKKKKEQVKRIPVDEVGSTPKSEKKKRVKKEEFIRFTKEYVEGDLFQSLVTAINQALAEQPYNLKVRKEMKCEYNNVKETGGPEALYFVQIVPEDNHRPHIRPKPQASNLPEPVKKKNGKEPKLKLRKLELEVLLDGVVKETLDNYATTYTKAVKFFSKKKGKVVAKSLAEFGVGKFFIDTKTNEICMMAGYNKEWKGFQYAVVMSKARNVGVMDNMKLKYLLQFCEPADSDIQDQYNALYEQKYGDLEQDLEPAKDVVDNNEETKKAKGKKKKKKKDRDSVKSSITPKVKNHKDRNFGKDFID